MYICNRCNGVFEVAGIEKDDVGYSYSICPYCGSEDIEEAVNCPVTGELMPKSRDVSEAAEVAIRKDLYGILTALNVMDDKGKRAVMQVISEWMEGQ